MSDQLKVCQVVIRVQSIDDGEWKVEAGRWNSFVSLPLGHQGPQHRTHLFVADGKSLVFVGLDIIAVKGKVEPEFGFLRFTERIVEAVLEDGLVPPFGKTLNDITAHRAGRTPDLVG